jgi:hypothetical protein
VKTCEKNRGVREWLKPMDGGVSCLPLRASVGKGSSGVFANI